MNSITTKTPMDRPFGNRRMILYAGALLVACGGSTPTGLGSIAGMFVLRSLNESPLPYAEGCCSYLSGSLVFTGNGYTISLSARNRVNGLEFTAVERGTYALNGSSITFTRIDFDVSPLLLDVGTVAQNGMEIRLRFGDEGPGSPLQFRSVFVRSP